MKPVTSDLLTFPTFIKTRASRHRSRVQCTFCYRPFRNKELRLCYRPPWKSRFWVRDMQFHQTCYGAYLQITALALFQEINAYGRNYKRKRHRTTS